MTCINVIHCIREPIGGGAELLVRELNRRLPAHGVQSKALYLTNTRSAALGENEYCLNLPNARRPRTLLSLEHFLKAHRTRHTVVHGHLTDALYALAMPGIAPGLRKVYTEHNTYNKRRNVPLFRQLEGYIYKQYDRVAAISEGTRLALLDWLGEQTFGARTETIPNGARLFELPSRRETPGDDGLRLISIGSLTRRKGFDRALEALATVECPISQYVIIGDGEERHRLQRHALELGVSDLVTFHGWRDDIENWLHDADMQIIPSRWEGFGLVAVEGLSTGLPVVATNVPGLNEVLQNCISAKLVDPDSAKAMARGIESLWSEKERWHHFACASRQRAEMFGLGPMVRKYAEFYEKVLTEQNKAAA